MTRRCRLKDQWKEAGQEEITWGQGRNKLDEERQMR